jgi:hypothetical protein
MDGSTLEISCCAAWLESLISQGPVFAILPAKQQRDYDARQFFFQYARATSFSIKWIFFSCVNTSLAAHITEPGPALNPKGIGFHYFLLHLIKNFLLLQYRLLASWLPSRPNGGLAN